MSGFLSKLLSPLNPNNEPADPALRQGARFNLMQSTITTPVLANLSLMNQTTGNGLGSITESMDNMNALDSLDKKELGELVNDENKYNGLLNQLQQKQKQLDNTISNMKKSKDGLNKIKKLQNEINSLNSEIMTQANQITKDAYNRNKANNNVQKGMNIESGNVQQKLNMIKNKKVAFNALLQQQSDLDGQIADRQNELDSSYINYMVWFLCATTLGIIAVRKLSQ